jgi:hypothetical protein
MTTRFTDAVRRTLRRLDAWTVDVCNPQDFRPQYPTPRD